MVRLAQLMAKWAFQFERNLNRTQMDQPSCLHVFIHIAHPTVQCACVSEKECYCVCEEQMRGLFTAAWTSLKKKGLRGTIDLPHTSASQCSKAGKINFRNLSAERRWREADGGESMMGGGETALNRRRLKWRNWASWQKSTVRGGAILALNGAQLHTVSASRALNRKVSCTWAVLMIPAL